MEVNSKFGERDRYTLKKFIGRGTYAEVWLALDNDTNIDVALKIYAPATGLDDYGLNVFAHEFSIVAGVNDSNLLIPKHYDSFDRRPFLVLPYCEKGSVKSLIGKTSEEQAWDMMLDVARGLKALHSMNPPIIHQDIKPDNIMIGNNGHYLISDFGVSAHLHSTLRRSMSESLSTAGTRAYMASERFSKRNAPIMASDIWSLGSSIYEMLTGDVPFGNDGGLLQKSGAEIPELIGDYSEDLRMLIEKCLAATPWDRPTAEQLEQLCLEHIDGITIKKDPPGGDDDDDSKMHKALIWTISAIAGLLLGIIIGFLQ